jgi:hypothetical protein
MKNKSYKISKSWNFERKEYKAKDSFKKPFDKKLCSMGSKCLTLDASHMCMKHSCQKNKFGCPLKLILGFSEIFCILTLNQNIHTQLCMNVKNHY